MNRQMAAGLRMVPVILTMGTIFFLSNQPGDSFSLPPIPDIDKLAHMAMYGLLAATVLFAVSERKKSRKLWLVVLFTVLFCTFYGISDEYHQSFVPGRCVDVYDVVADCGGAVAACFLWAGWRKRLTMVRCR